MQKNNDLKSKTQRNAEQQVSMKDRATQRGNVQKGSKKGVAKNSAVTKVDKLANKFSINFQFSDIAENKINVLLWLVVFVGFVLRFIFLDQNPPALNQDEAINGYNAYSISKTFMDSRGYFLPAVMHGFGNVDFRPPLYAYLSVPFMWVFGLSETSTRMAALVLNVALIPLVYFFVNKLFNNKVVALVSAVLLTMNPWNFHYSRVGHEAVVSPFFYFLAITLLYLCLKDDKYNKLFALAGAVFGISMYAYPVAQMLSPLLALFVCIVYRKEAFKKIKYLLIAAGAAIVVLLPMIINLLSPNRAESRLSQVTIFGRSNVLGNFINNYFAHFSPNFLFFKGDTANLPGTAGVYGVFHWYIIPFIVIGLIYLIKLIINKEYVREAYLILGFLVLYPLPAAITMDSPHSLRAYTLIPVFHIISAVGIWGAVSFLNKIRIEARYRIAIYSIVSVIVFGVFANFLNNYYFKYPKVAEAYYQYGIKQAVQYIAENQNKYEKIYFTAYANQPYIYMLFYLNYDPLKYINSPKKADYEGFGKVEQFDKYNFLEDEKMPFSEDKSLFVTRAIKIPGKHFVGAVKDSTNRPVLYIWD